MRATYSYWGNQRLRNNMKHFQPEFELEGGKGSPPGLGNLDRVVRANRVAARQLGWGHVIGGQVQAIPQIRRLLGLGPSPSEADLAQAIASWQRTVLGQQGSGQLDSRTWDQMRRSPQSGLPVPQFTPLRWFVKFNGRTLGLIEKAGPYRKCYIIYPASIDCRPDPSGSDNHGSAQIELGFRITDIEAVREAGFVDPTGQGAFRWIQIINPPTGNTFAQGPDPYYPPNANRQAHGNGLAYDLLFQAQPLMDLSLAVPGRRAFFNYELALVGIRAGSPTRNVILNTVLWGFDFVVEGGSRTVYLNKLQAGPRGGSSNFKNIMNRDKARGRFPTHCFIGEGYRGTARCG